MRAAGRGYTAAGDDTELDFDASAKGRLSFPIVGPLGLRAGVELVVPFRRDVFRYDDASGSPHTLFVRGAAAGVGDLGLGVSLP
jgi:hypothetical protein